MTEVDDFFAERGPRVVNGRYLIDGESYTRATTHAGTLEDPYRLHQWEIREVGHNLAKRPDLIARASVTDPSDKGPWEEIIEQARSAGSGNAKANWGTALHGAFELWARTGVFPDQAEERIQRALITVSHELARYGIKIRAQYTERRVINHAQGVAGTTDGIAELADGTLAILDFKPHTDHVDLSAPKWVIQLADYAWSDTMIVDDDQHIPMPSVSRDIAIVIMVGLHGDAAEVDIRIAPLTVGRHGSVLADQVRQWRRETARHLLVPFTNSPRTQAAVDGARALASPPVEVPEPQASPAAPTAAPTPVLAMQQVTNASLPTDSERVALDASGVAWRVPAGTTDADLVAHGMTPVEQVPGPSVERPSGPLAKIYLPKNVDLTEVRAVVATVTGPVWAALLVPETDDKGHLSGTVPAGQAQAVQEALVVAFAPREQPEPTAAPQAAPFPASDAGRVPVPAGGSDPVLPAQQAVPAPVTGPTLATFPAEQAAAIVTNPQPIRGDFGQPAPVGTPDDDVEALLKRHKGKAEMQAAARAVGVTDLAHTRKVLAQAMTALPNWPTLRVTALGITEAQPVVARETVVPSGPPYQPLGASPQVTSMPPAQTPGLSPQAQQITANVQAIQAGVNPATGQPIPGASMPAAAPVPAASMQGDPFAAPALVDPTSPHVNADHPLITELVSALGQAVTREDLTAVWQRATAHGLTWETAGGGVLAATGRLRNQQISAQKAINSDG